MKTLAVVVVVAIVMFTIINTLKTKNYRKLIGYLEKGDYNSFYKTIETKKIKLLFPKSSLLDLKLNASLVQQNKKEAIFYLEQLCSLPLTTPQKENYYMKAFNFFVGLNDKKNSKKYLDLINALDNERMKMEANRVYNIYILKNDKYLSELKEELEGMEDYQKGVNEYLISIIYKNKKDFENAKKYEALSKEHFALVDAETKKKYTN